MKTIIFDRNSVFWTEETGYNLLFIMGNMNHLRDLCKHRGYVYLNTIYEHLGSAWDPDGENICYRETTGGFDYEIKPAEDDRYLIHIS